MRRWSVARSRAISAACANGCFFVAIFAAFAIHDVRRSVLDTFVPLPTLVLPCSQMIAYRFAALLVAVLMAVVRC
jgi:hypothetical protein